MKPYGMRIGGRVVTGSRVETIRSPWDRAPVGEVAVGGPEDMELAIRAAVDAFEVMRRLPTHRRSAILQGVSRRLAERSAELARLMALESGKPIRYCRAEVDRAVVTFGLGAAECTRYGGEVLPIDLEPRAEGRLCLSVRVPRGPVAAISPFNFPLNLVAHKVSPAVAIGASVVLKPPPQAPLTSHLLADIAAEAGLPDGAFNVVHCPPEVAQGMVEDPRLAVLSFTGSDGVGWHLKSRAGKKQVLLELGGNAPCIVDAGADLDRALPPITAAAWASAGQVCIKVQRLYVHRSLYTDFVERFVAATRDVVCGDPLREDTVVGPLIEQRHVTRVLSWIREAVDGGATLHCGGQADGQLVYPTILTGVHRDAKVLCEEVFGPVTVVQSFDRFEDAIAACNDTRFGLQAGVFTPHLQHVLQAFRELAYGGVIVNDVPTFRVDNFAYGGTRDSGMGREGVRYAMEEMSELKTLILS